MKMICETKDCGKLAEVMFMTMGLDLVAKERNCCNICMKKVMKSHLDKGGCVIDGMDDKNIKVSSFKDKA